MSGQDTKTTQTDYSFIASCLVGGGLAMFPIGVFVADDSTICITGETYIDGDGEQITENIELMPEQVDILIGWLVAAKDVAATFRDARKERK